ncbi:phosphoglycerate dehydrogenase [bacterium]|jgi:phosphoglycerate dehydrogenase-like enzyme|nr:phosphoglycerate dehydrogenase [bacterium]
MNDIDKVAVCSRSFSKNITLREELLRKYKNVTFNDDGIKFDKEGLIEFLDGHDKAIIALENIDDFVLSRLPSLKIVSKYGVGLDTINLESMEKYGISLGWEGGVNKRSVSELVVSYAIALLHRTVYSNAEVRRGLWYQVIGRQLSSCTVGIIGCGNIGKDVIKLLKPFKCKFVAHDLLYFKKFYQENHVKSVSLEKLLSVSDVVTLHLPLDSSTRNILNASNLKFLKNNSVLINLARGGLVDEKELRIMLEAGRISGIALDVLEKEPLNDLSFSEEDNVLITPHIGGSTEESIINMGLSAIKGLDNYYNPFHFSKPYSIAPQQIKTTI